MSKKTTTAAPAGVQAFGEMMMRGETPLPQGGGVEMMMTDISKDAVEAMAIELATNVATDDEAWPMPNIREAAAILRAQSARIAELERDRDEWKQAAGHLLSAVPVSEILDVGGSISDLALWMKARYNDSKTISKLEAALVTARADALVEAANTCKYNSAEWDSVARSHKLVKWSLNIECAHVGNAYERAVLALIPSNSTPEPTAAMFGMGGDDDDF